MSFVKECVNENIEIWKRCLESDFVKELAKGTLDKEKFKGYIIDDSLYLREYAKVFAYGMIKSKSMNEIKIYYSLLSFVNESEDTARKYYLKEFGIDENSIWEMNQRKENKNYTEYMLKVAKEAQGPAECIMACLPCMLSYGWIFKQIKACVNKDYNSFYKRFMDDYGDEQYEILCDKWTEYADECILSADNKMKNKCKEIFKKCSEYELEFWEMSANTRWDI